jgi:hypothetical protein
MLRRVTIVRADVSEEPSESIAKMMQRGITVRNAVFWDVNAVWFL